MISAVFVDRPRLAIVISVLITLAGLIALAAIPVAQFPDIVPPEVSVSTSYPGANAEVVEQTVAQVIEREVNGVSDMLYMRSTSGNDGSYSLTVSFAVGTDPETNTVNVQNRVQRAMSRLPSEVQQNGVLVEKQSSAILQVVVLRSPKGTRDSLFLSNYMLINIRDAISRIPGVGQANMFGQQDYAMRIWLDMDRLTGARADAAGRDRRGARAECAGRGRPHRRRAGRRGAAADDPADDARPARNPGAIRRDHRARPAERLADPGARRGAGRSRRAIGRRVFDVSTASRPRRWGSIWRRARNAVATAAAVRADDGRRWPSAFPRT